MDPGWVTALTALAAAVIGCVGWAARYAWRIVSRTTRFLDDYFGTPEHDGLESTPGVMARLKTVEGLVTEVVSELSKVAAETKPNGGTSLHDVMARIGRSVEEIRAEQAQMRARMELFEKRRGGEGEP